MSLVLLLCVQHLPRLPHFPQFVSYLRLLSHLFTHASLLVPPDLVWSLRRGVSHSNGFFVRGCFATFAIFSPQFNFVCYCLWFRPLYCHISCGEFRPVSFAHSVVF